MLVAIDAFPDSMIFKYENVTGEDAPKIVFDLLFLAFLLSWRRGDDGQTIAPGGTGTLPEYSETEVKDYH